MPVLPPRCENPPCCKIASRWRWVTLLGVVLMKYSEAGGGAEMKAALAQRCAAKRVVFQIQVTVQIEIIDEPAEVGCGGVGERAVAVAADQDFQAMRARGRDQAQRTVEPAALHQLDVDAVDRAD